MNRTPYTGRLKAITKGFVDPLEGVIYVTSEKDLHENLARDLCRQLGFVDWQFSAEDYLVSKRKWIKISNYGEKDDQAFRYIAVAVQYANQKKVREWLEYLTAVLGICVIEY